MTVNETIRYFSIGEFTIDQKTGVISTAQLLDREVTPFYIFAVQTLNQDPLNPRFNTTTVMIHIADQNDNTPVFSASQFAVNVSEEVTPGVSVLNVSKVQY